MREGAGSETGGIPLTEIMPGSEGGLHAYFPTFSNPVLEGVYLSGIILLYVGTLLLALLVKHRPQTGMHALYGPERCRFIRRAGFLGRGVTPCAAMVRCSYSCSDSAVRRQLSAP